MLQEMVAKAGAEKKAEEVKFSAFAQWCDDTRRVKEEEIAEKTQRIETLKARIEKAAVEIEKLTARWQELDEDVGRWAKDMRSATEVRDKEADDYQSTNLDYTETIAALEKAIAILKKQSFDRSQAEALLQVRSSKLLPLAAKLALSTFLQDGQPSLAETSTALGDDPLDVKAPEAAAYTFQSGGIIDMLEKLKDEFGVKQRELEKEELGARHAFEQMLQQLTDSTENAKHEIAKKKELSAEIAQAKAEAEGDLEQTTADLAEDESYLEDMTLLCRQKSQDYESRQKIRAEEIVAIQKAIEIISGAEVSGVAEKHLPSLVQIAAARGRASSAQLRAAERSPIQARIAEFLAAKAQASGSKLLSLVAQRCAEDPFTKVKKLIKDLIVKLMEEATAETEHKGWCDTELTTNKQTRDSKTADVNKLTSEVEDLTAEIAQLTQSLADLAEEVGALTTAMAKAEADRTASKEKNAETIEEAKGAQAAVQQAMAILKEYYAKSAEATALMQRRRGPADDAPETFDAPYQGMLPESGNVISFLEVILADFARLESEAATAEATEQATFEKFMFESKKDKALKENEIGHKESKRVDKESALQSAKEELQASQDQLDKAIAYYEKLKPTCVDSGITYEERVKRREEEIQSLQEALQILSGEDIA